MPYLVGCADCGSSQRKKEKQNRITYVAGLTYTLYPWLTKYHVYLKRARRRNMKLKFMPCSKSEFEREYGRQTGCQLPCFSQKAFTVHYCLVRLSGTYLMREKQTPIKLFHKALAHWTPKQNLSPCRKYKSSGMPMHSLSSINPQFKIQ